MAANDPKIHKASGALGDLSMEFQGEQYQGNPPLDTKVELTGGTICWITWGDKENFEKEINDVIAKYRI